MAIKLPTSADVPVVDPRVTADPGVRAPRAAFEDTAGIAARELTPAFEQLSRIAIAQQSRRDTVNRANAMNQFNLEADNELRRLNTEADLSDEQVLQQYGEFLSKRKGELLQSHVGSPNSNAALQVRLSDIENQAHGRAAALSATLGRQKVIDTYKNNLGPLVTRASQAPTLQTVDKEFQNLETTIGDMKDALSPEDEHNLRQYGRQEIALATLESLINRGRTEAAEAMLTQGGLNTALTPDVQRQVLNKIQTVRATKNGLQEWTQQFYAVMGRMPTDREWLKKLGVADPITDRQRFRDNLAGRGMSPDLASDISNGTVHIIQDQKFGGFWEYNMATGERRKVSEADSAVLGGMIQGGAPQAGGTRQNFAQPLPPQAEAQQPAQPAQPQQQEVPRPRALEQAAELGTGPFAGFKEMVSTYIGGFRKGQMYPATTQAKNALRRFNQQVKIALVNNPRLPGFEQKAVDQYLAEPDAFFNDPDVQRKNMNDLYNYLIERRDAKVKELAGGKKMTVDHRGDLYDNISSISEILSLMEKPGYPEISTTDEYDKLKSGDVFIWTPTGEPRRKP